MSDGVLITARLKSKRLPKKIIKKLINGDTVIEYLIKNLKKVFNAKKIVLITSKSNQDLVLTKIAEKNGIKFFRGHAQDVLDRMFRASQKYRFKNIISCTADNPLIDANYAKKILKFHKQKKNDLTTNLTLPIGMFAYAIKTESLKKIIKIKNSKNTETWVEYFQKMKNLKTDDYGKPKIKENLRLTIDYIEDYKTVNQVLKNSSSEFPRVNDILKLSKKKPCIFKINSHTKQKVVVKPKFKKI